MKSDACQVRRAVQGFEPYSPGRSIDEIRELYGLDTVIKLASNENPLGASPLVQKAVQRAASGVFRYTQSGTPRLAAAIAAHHGTDPACVVTGNGSDEVIDLLIRCKAEPGLNNVVTFDPCFSLYPLQTRLCGVELRQAKLNPDFTFNWAGMRALIDENTALVFVTTPDNPSGYAPPVAELAALAESLPQGALLVIDEAYMDFAAASQGENNAKISEFSLLPRIAEYGNIAVLRTFSKSWGLAGLRLGYGIMPAELADYLCRVRPPFSVNILAEAAGLAALEDKDFRRATLLAVEEGRAYLAGELAALGCKVYPSHSNFIMFGLPENSALSPDGLFEALLRRGLIIRQLKSYKLPQFLRVSVGNSDENHALISAMRDLLNG